MIANPPSDVDRLSLAIARDTLDTSAQNVESRSARDEFFVEKLLHLRTGAVEASNSGDGATNPELSIAEIESMQV